MPVVYAVAVPHPPLIVPQVGKGEEAGIAATSAAFAAAMAALAAARPDAVVVISPHAADYADWIHLSPGAHARGSLAAFGAPDVRIQAAYDRALCAAIEGEAQRAGLPAGTAGEREPALDHGTLIPLYFLQKAMNPLPLVVRVGLSGLPAEDHYRMGRCIAAACGEKRVAIVASGDLSHRLKADGPYGFAPEGPELDSWITGALASADFGRLLKTDEALAEKGAECGLRAFIMMAGALDGRAVEAGLLSYEGPFGVGYAVATFAPGGPSPRRHFVAAAAGARQSEDAWVRLARSQIESVVRTGKGVSLPGGLPPELTQRRAGVFVSLHLHGRLRGCIGTTAPTAASVAEEILQNAVSAATEDPRFSPVRPGELDGLEINVDVLGDAEPVAGEDELDPVRYGVIVSSGGRRGLLLPDLEGVDTVRQQVDIARQKACIPPGAPVALERFEVTRHT